MFSVFASRLSLYNLVKNRPAKKKRTHSEIPCNFAPKSWGFSSQGVIRKKKTQKKRKKKNGTATPPTSRYTEYAHNSKGRGRMGTSGRRKGSPRKRRITRELPRLKLSIFLLRLHMWHPCARNQLDPSVCDGLRAGWSQNPPNVLPPTLPYPTRVALARDMHAPSLKNRPRYFEWRGYAWPGWAFRARSNPNLPFTPKSPTLRATVIESEQP